MKKEKKLKRNLMPARLKRVKKELEIVSHNFVRRRDSINDYEIKGYCFDCGELAEGPQFQAGHFEPSGSCGALLRYHPHNMQGQKGGCNVAWQQEKVKIAYTLKMVEKYGKERVEELRRLKHRNIKADIYYYETLLELYKQGEEDRIVRFLESYPHV